MKRFFLLLFPVLLFAAGCSKSDSAPQVPKPPRVATAPVEEYGQTTAVLGGAVFDAELPALKQVGVQYVAWEVGAEVAPAWDAATMRTAPQVALSWSFEVAGLNPETGYAVRAFAQATDGKEYFGAVATFTTDPADVLPPVVTTAEITDYDAVSALLGGSVSGAELSALTEAGVQCVAWGDAAAQEPDWTKAVDYAAEPAASWSVRASGLSESTKHAARAYVGVSGRRYYGAVKSFVTLSAARQPLTVAALRQKYTASADVSEQSVRGYVALSIPADCTTESFAAGTVILYDNTGVSASAIALCDDGVATGIGTVGLKAGDFVEVSLAGAERMAAIPRYGKITADKVRVLGSGTRIDPVWVTPAQLASNASPYFCSPVKLSRVYAETPGGLFSAVGTRFTDGAAFVTVFAKAGSVVGLLEKNGATGTLGGICWEDGGVRIVPVTAGDVAAFTGAEGALEGDPKIELLNGKTDFEFAPQGGTLVVDCRITRPAGMRLFADVRNLDTGRYSVDIEGDRVSITARANTSGLTAGYSNCYLYLADSKEGSRKATATLKITQISGVYESIPALIQANGGESSSVHTATVNGANTLGMKLGSGEYTGHYTSDPLGVEGPRKLVLYAVGWAEGKHDAGTLYLRVEGGGSASVASIPLKINAGATGIAPFVMSVGTESRYEVTLTGLTLDSRISFSTSPTFDKKKDDKTGRALLFGVQLAD